MKAMMLCELCNGEAALYCCSDSAFLCFNCDAKVHAANFLVARHVRRILCSDSNCTGLIFSGSKFLQLLRSHLCNSCSLMAPEDHDHESDCISSTESSSTRGSDLPCSKPKVVKASTGSSSRGLQAERILVNWCSKLEVDPISIVVEVARHALRNLPHRVGLAASLWFSLKQPERRWQQLKRLEVVSGVPAKLIVAGHSKLGRILINNKLRRAHHHHQESQEPEGWDEC